VNKPKKRTVKDIRLMKHDEKKICVLTAYDVAMAGLLDQSGMDIILVGDSLAMVTLGYNSTVPVTMDEMLHHARAVSRGVRQALLVGDMPFGSYQIDSREAIVNAIRFLKEAGCDAVKVEGGAEVAETISAMVKAGIPVMSHIGLTPQTASQLGGFKVQGKDLDSARQLINDAKALEEAGAFAIVLECVPGQLAGIITQKIGIPTIGIGAGPLCDGQVLVTHDLLGLFEKFRPSFIKQYVNLAPRIKDAITAFRDEVQSGAFPAKEHTFDGSDDLARLIKEE
jgi:3-methyl-2-oxobutanoate hydroxymethyltransferase